jgi:hypothetical protein
MELSTLKKEFEKKKMQKLTNKEEEIMQWCLKLFRGMAEINEDHPQ